MYCKNGKDHAHIVTKGSMKMAHNLDDRHERAHLHTASEEEVESSVTPVPTQTAKRIVSNLDAIRNALRERDNR